MQKLTLELKEQKEQAQLVRGQGAGRGLALGRGLRRPHPPVGLLEQEKAHLEEQLMQTKQLLQQVEAELQALEKSCLLQLARSSWIGRMLRSSTGSVEVSLCPTCPPRPSWDFPHAWDWEGMPWALPAWHSAVDASDAGEVQGERCLEGTGVSVSPAPACWSLAPSCRW